MASSPRFGKAKRGGMKMTANDYWNIFLLTGAPAAYLLYNQARKTEKQNVSDDTGIGAQSYGLQ